MTIRTILVYITLSSITLSGYESFEEFKCNSFNTLFPKSPQQNYLASVIENPQTTSEQRLKSQLLSAHYCLLEGNAWQASNIYADLARANTTPASTKAYAQFQQAFIAYKQSSLFWLMGSDNTKSVILDPACIEWDFNPDNDTSEEIVGQFTTVINNPHADAAIKQHAQLCIAIIRGFAVHSKFRNKKKAQHLFEAIMQEQCPERPDLYFEAHFWLAELFMGFHFLRIDLTQKQIDNVSPRIRNLYETSLQSTSYFIQNSAKLRLIQLYFWGNTTNLKKGLTFCQEIIDGKSLPEEKAFAQAFMADILATQKHASAADKQKAGNLYAQIKRCKQLQTHNVDILNQRYKKIKKKLS